MAYLVKTITGEPLRMEMAQLREALQRGVITEQWMARDERQDFWYSVAMLFGRVPAELVRARCAHCAIAFHARHIDIGLPVPCPKCGGTIVVPDPLHVEQRAVDATLLGAARREMFEAFLCFAAGAIVTFGTYFYRDRYAGGFLIWPGPLLLVLGFFLVKSNDARELKRKLRKSREAEK